METVDPLWRPLTGASRKKKKKIFWVKITQSSFWAKITWSSLFWVKINTVLFLGENNMECYFLCENNSPLFG